jgi:hypothetical protein
MPDEDIFAPKNGWPVAAVLRGQKTILRSLYAFLSVDEGGEGVCARQIGDTMYPMIFSSPKMAETMKADAKHLSQMTGKRIVLVEFKRNGKELWSTEAK